MRVDQKYNKDLKVTSEFLKKEVNNWKEYETLIILGSGYNPIGDTFKIIKKIKYQEIPNFPTCTAPHHLGNLLFAEYKNKKIIIMQGRFHYCEGYEMKELAFPIYAFSLMNVKNMICTNAAASLKPNKIKVGEICLVKDHMNFFFDNPVISVNLPHIKTRWPIPQNIYNDKLRKEVLNICKKNNIKITEGVYAAYPGGIFETASEAKLYQQYADMIGMSIIPEVIAAFHSEMKICALSTATVYGVGMNNKDIDDDIIMEQTKIITKNIEKIIKELITRIS